MNGVDFKSWVARLGLTYKAAAQVLGLSERSAYNYAAGWEIPLYIELACEALETRFNTAPPDLDEGLQRLKSAQSLILRDTLAEISRGAKIKRVSQSEETDITIEVAEAHEFVLHHMR